MFCKFSLIELYFALFFSLKINVCIYISSGLNTLNKFLYISRISKYFNQSQINLCSLSDGPICYFTENNFAKHYLKTNNENKNSKIDDKWVKLLSKIPKNNYKRTLYHLSKITSNYINSYINETDKEQTPKNDKLFILMTFDDETTKENTYLEKLTSVFYNERLIADFEGKLRLFDDHDLSEENTKISDYPSKLYGIIESEFITISFRGKFFICNYVYIRAHDEQSKSEEIKFYGFLGENIKFEYSYTDNKERKEKWLKVFFPSEVEVVDKLVISGPYDIDNISFTFLYKINVDEEENYYLYNHQKVEKLIENDDL
jgi:hypothetical protein